MKPGGHFIFDTRNPFTRVWEKWEKDTTPDFAIDEASGDLLEIWTSYEGFQEGIFTFYEKVVNTRTTKILVHEKMQLKFRTEDEIQKSLTDEGFAHIQVFGDWCFELATEESESFIFHCVK